MKKYLLNKEKLRYQDSLVIEKNKHRMHLLEPIIESLKTIPYALIKGEALSIMAYGDVGYRNSDDVDFLIPRVYSKEVKKILKDNGFIEGLFDKNGEYRKMTRLEEIIFTNSHQIAPYEKRMEDGFLVAVDFNTNIFWGEYKNKSIDIIDYLSDVRKMEIYGINVNVLSDMKCFIQTCLHHYKEMNAPHYFFVKNSYSEYMFQDIYCLYKNKIHSKIRELIEAVHNYGIEDEIYFILYYSSLVFQDEELHKVSRMFETEHGIRKLNQFGLNKGGRVDWPIPFEERMNHPNIYEVIEPLLSSDDKERISSIYML